MGIAGCAAIAREVLDCSPQSILFHRPNSNIYVLGIVNAISTPCTSIHIAVFSRNVCVWGMVHIDSKIFKQLGLLNAILTNCTQTTGCLQLLRTQKWAFRAELRVLANSNNPVSAATNSALFINANHQRNFR